MKQTTLYEIYTYPSFVYKLMIKFSIYFMLRQNSALNNLMYFETLNLKLILENMSQEIDLEIVLDTE